MKKEEREAIIRIVKNKINTINEGNKKEYLASYKPTDAYIKLKAFITQRDELARLADKIESDIERLADSNVSVRRAIRFGRNQEALNRLALEEANFYTKEYRVNEDEIRDYLILNDNRKDLDEIINQVIESIIKKEDKQ